MLHKTFIAWILLLDQKFERTPVKLLCQSHRITFQPNQEAHFHSYLKLKLAFDTGNTATHGLSRIHTAQCHSTSVAMLPRPAYTTALPQCPADGILFTTVAKTVFGSATQLLLKPHQCPYDFYVKPHVDYHKSLCPVQITCLRFSLSIPTTGWKFPLGCPLDSSHSRYPKPKGFSVNCLSDCQLKTLESFLISHYRCIFQGNHACHQYFKCSKH